MPQPHQDTWEILDSAGVSLLSQVSDPDTISNAMTALADRAADLNEVAGAMLRREAIECLKIAGIDHASNLVAAAFREAKRKRTPPRPAAVLDRGDHVELAGRVVAILRGQSPTVYADGDFYQYGDRGIFSKLTKPELSRTVQGFAGLMVERDHKPLYIKAADVTGTVKLAADQAADPEFFNGAPSGIAFSNAFVQVEATGITVHEHSPEHRARFAFGFDYQPESLPDRLLLFFGEVWANDSEDERAAKTALFQEYVGVSLLGVATRFQRVLVFVGEGANGKGVASIIIEGCMPPGSTCAIPPQDLGQEYRRAMLAGKLINIVSELPEADILDSESWKAIVAGDMTTARAIRDAPFNFKPIAGHIYSANRLPGSTDQTHGFWRRLLVMRFERVFREEDQDPNIAATIIAAERPAIVAWALRGAHRALAAGRLSVPASSVDAVDDWQKHSDQVRAFVDARCEPLLQDLPATAGASAASLYQIYRRWAEENGHRAMASNKFAARMKAIGLAAAHTRTGNFYPLEVKP